MNRLLAALPGRDRDRLLARAERVPLELHSRLHEQDEQIDALYFPDSGAISALTVMRDGALIDALLIGSEGVLGFPAVLDDVRSPWRAVVQIPGEAWRVDRRTFVEEVEQSAALRAMLIRFANRLIVFAAQSIACNRFHQLPPRAARWLLLLQDHAGQDEFRLTQDFFAQMLGVHRPSVTLTEQALQEARLIHYHRGTVRVTDRRGLERMACECYTRTRSRLDRLGTMPTVE
jgi:CRP-like cAMP-binding protein